MASIGEPSPPTNSQAEDLSYRELAEAKPQQVWTAKPDGSLDYVNRQVTDYFQQTSEELLGAGWLGVVHPDDLALAVERWTHSIGSGDPYEIEFRLKRPDVGVYRWHLGRASPIRDGAGRIIRWIGTNTDIHDRKLVEAELVLARAAADHANHAKSEFLASMSHELRTPLNAILGYGEMILEEAQTAIQPELVRDMEKILSSGRHLLELINAVLDLSKIEAGKMELYLETFGVAGILEQVVSVIQPMADRNRNTIRVAIHDGITGIHADRTKVRQSLLNLMSNACKFTTGGRVEVDVRMAAGGETIVFVVSDSGIGMTPEQAGRLFQPFAQASASVGRDFGGTGLGLTISRQFAKMMGGDISVQTEPGKGSSFTLVLPVIVYAGAYA